MLNIIGLNRFFLVRDFHDMRCKYDKVLSIIHQQLNREPKDGDVFIVMSKDYVWCVCSAMTAVLTVCLRDVSDPATSLCR